MIIFLGAGASRPFGVPTMAEFIDIFDKAIGGNKLYNGVKNSFDRESFDLEVLMTILDDLSKDQKELRRTISPQTTDFLLRRPHEKALYYISDETVKTTAKEVLSKLKGIIRRECFQAVQKKVDMILQVYDQLFNILRQSEIVRHKIGNFTIAGDGRYQYPMNLRIFTTNYDTCVEALLSRHEVNFTRGIEYRHGYDVFNVDSFDDKDGKVGVFKLHGSVDLFRRKGKITQLPLYSKEEGMTYLGEEIGEELMRFPIEFGGYRHVIESPYLDLFRLFRDRIRRDPLWILIGSSFRDVTICSIMNDVLTLQKSGEHPMIILVNPNAKAIVDRLKKWGMDAFARLIRIVEERFGTRECITKLSEVLNPERTLRERKQKLSVTRP